MGYLHAEALSVSSFLEALPIMLPALDGLSILTATRTGTGPDGQRAIRVSGAPGRGERPRVSAPRCSSSNNAGRSTMVNRVVLSNKGLVAMEHSAQWSRSPVAGSNGRI